jgi:AraC-like DNA-binding protein/quercetin dioxygenase-like cupin family protein
MTVSNSFDYFTIKGYNKSKVGKKTKEIGQKRAMAMINYIEKHLKTFSVRPHRHNYWEIIYVTEGEGTIKTANLQVINYKKGELLCIPPYLTHLNDSSTGFKNIHFTIEDWEPNRQEPFLIPQSDFLKDFYSVLKLTYRYFHQFPIDHPINIAFSTSVETFLNELIKQSHAHNITQIIIHEIISHYRETDFDLEQTYKLVPLSKDHIRRVFIKEHGISPSQFLLQKRLSLAKKLLSQKADGYLRVNEIAVTCGFEDPAYFCRVFKRATGMSPNKYQLQILESNKVYPSPKENKGFLTLYDIFE